MACKLRGLKLLKLFVSLKTTICRLFKKHVKSVEYIADWFKVLIHSCIETATNDDVSAIFLTGPCVCNRLRELTGNDHVMPGISTSNFPLKYSDVQMEYTHDTLGLYQGFIERFCSVFRLDMKLLSVYNVYRMQACMRSTDSTVAMASRGTAYPWYLYARTVYTVNLLFHCG